MSQDNRIIVTHCVDPHHFYFKYLNDCVNSEYSKFDYEVQRYGNELHAQNIQDIGYMGYSPNKNEIVIFFDLIFNKWLRGRVINDDNNKITLWCFDNGLFRRSDVQFIQPLTDTLKRDLNLVHLGGLTVLPAKNRLDVYTLNVEMQVTNSWDNEIKEIFKVIVDSSKRFVFIEEMVLGQHRFGMLRTELKNGKVVLINEILLQMNKAIACGPFVKDMSSYVSKERLEKELYESLEETYTTTSPKANNSTTTSIASAVSDINVPLMIESSDGANSLKLASHFTNQNDDNNLNRSHNEIIVNFDNLSKVREEAVSSSSSLNCSKNECFDSFDESASMAVSSVCSFENHLSVSQSELHRNEDHTNPFDYKYKCYLSTFSAGKNEKLRKPLQSSIDWINQFCLPVANADADDDMSCISSIIALGDNAVADKNEILRKPLQSSFDWINQFCSPVANGDADDNKSSMSSIIALGDCGSSSSSTVSANGSNKQ